MKYTASTGRVIELDDTVLLLELLALAPPSMIDVKGVSVCDVAASLLRPLSAAPHIIGTYMHIYMHVNHAGSVSLS